MIFEKEVIMFDHLGIQFRNLEASVRFYTAALAPLGQVLCSRDEASAGIGPAGAPGLWLYQAPAPDPVRAGAHLALRAPDRATVDRFHAVGLAVGGRDHGRPGPRPDYGPTYYAAFLLDPDGNNVEAVCLE
jgi:catechol 2,3-dioxygenase-like lactoylglutathione lyase family enzyme